MKLLYITSRFPYPLEKGDKLRAYYHIKELNKHLDIYVLALSRNKPDSASIKAVQNICTELFYHYEPSWKYRLRLLAPSGLPFQVKYFKSSKFEQLIRKSIRKIEPDHVHYHLIRTAGLAPELSARSTLDLMDCFSLGLSNLKKSKPWWKKLIFSLEERLVRTFEQNSLARFERCFIISERDREVLDPHDTYQIIISKNGIDLNFFNEELPIPSLNGHYDVIFVGNLGYAPNTEAARFIKKLAGRMQNRTFGIAGARSSVLRHIAFPPNVKVIGWVDDIRSAYLAGTVFLAPIFHGSGLQNKVLEAMALGRPCVTSSFVNEALGANPNIDLLIADDLDTTEQKLERMLHDDVYRTQIAKTGQAYVRKYYSWESQVDGLIDYICKKEK